MAPSNDLAAVVGVPSTVACGPPTMDVPSAGVATSTHESAGVTNVYPLEVLTMALELGPEEPIPDCPPKATLIVIRPFVVLVNVSSQRPQFSPRLMKIDREIVTPPMSTDFVVLNRSMPSKWRPKPRMTS